MNGDGNIRLSPHKLLLCALIDHYLNAQLHPIYKKSLSIVLLKYIKNPDSYNEPTLYNVIVELRKARVSNVFLSQDLIEYLTFETIDDLHQFFSSIKIFFEKERLDEEEEDEDNQPKEYLETKSILGLFVKKVLLVFNQSLFDGLISLFNQTHHYINQYHNDISTNINKNNNNTNTSNNSNKITFLSPVDQERYVYEEISKINNSIGKVNPLHLKEHIDIIKSILPNVNKSRYIDLISSLSHMDYEQSVEELHRYFDYCNGDGLLSNNALLPYAVFNLSKLHYHFGHYEQSYLSLQETIRIAQERNDNSCLALALNMLSKFQHRSVILSMDNIDHFQPHSQQDILDKGIQRASELDMHSLSSTNLLLKTKLNLNNIGAGRSTATTSTPSTSSKQTINSNNNNQSKYYNDVFSLLESSQQINHSNNQSILQMKSTVWEMFGNLELSNYFTELSLRFNNSSHLNDFIHNQSNSSKDSIISYCKLALAQCKKGDFELAQNIIGYCMKEYPYHTHIKSVLLYCSLCVMFEVALAENCLDRAHLVLESLLPLLNRLSPDDSEQAGWPQIFATYALVGRYFIKIQQYDVAHQFLNDAIRLARDAGYESLTTEFHVLLAQLFQQCGGSGILSMQSGMNNMLCALSLSDHYHQPALVAESSLLLINTHLESGDFERAYTLLEATLPTVLQDCHLQAKLYLLYAKTIMREAKFSKSVDKKRGIEYLEKAHACAKQLSNKDMLNEISSYLKDTIK